jgi:hypothetical protein
LAHRNIDLVDAGGLLLGSLCHFRNQGIDLDHLADDAPKGLSGLADRQTEYVDALPKSPIFRTKGSRAARQDEGKQNPNKPL